MSLMPQIVKQGLFININLNPDVTDTFPTGARPGSFPGMPLTSRHLDLVLNQTMTSYSDSVHLGETQQNPRVAFLNSVVTLGMCHSMGIGARATKLAQITGIGVPSGSINFLSARNHIFGKILMIFYKVSSIATIKNQKTTA